MSSGNVQATVRGEAHGEGVTAGLPWKMARGKQHASMHLRARVRAGRELVIAAVKQAPASMTGTSASTRVLYSVLHE